jgi:D-tagatose-1,6-bisphosphate aldolase subunit GatZ/KbaZ
MNILDSIIQAQKSGQVMGITSICSAHPFVLEAALRHVLAHNIPVLIEATCNQVNQFGGYTGYTPLGFMQFLVSLAERVGFPLNRLILGGDHLGPFPWSGEPAEVAMKKAHQLVREFVLAGFNKIHLDCSMPCAGEIELPVEVAAQRTAFLALDAERTSREAGLPPPRYVVGTEVPIPGGAQAEQGLLSITDPADAARTIEMTRHAFSSLGLDGAWNRVIALVVQPGVEFGDDTVHTYDRVAARWLTRFIETVPGLVYEAHSTDYQPEPALRSLVEDHYAILKVGPMLTFAFREAVFALEQFERELFPPSECSNVAQTLEEAALQNPVYWQKYYRGNPQEQAFKRKNSLSDRIRYYWADPHVQKAFARLLDHFSGTPIPLSLLSQFMPDLYPAVHDGSIPNRGISLLFARIQSVLEDYRMACSIDWK